MEIGIHGFKPINIDEKANKKVNTRLAPSLIWFLATLYLALIVN
jgi:hypothetical protein